METSQPQRLSHPSRKPTPEAGDSKRRDASGSPAGASPAVNHTSCRLAHQPQAVARARRIVQSMLRSWRIGEDAAASAVLVVSELVTNAVEHARPPLFLHVRLDDAEPQLWVGVTDGGPTAREGAWTACRSRDEQGRGLFIVDALATAHGTHKHRGGATHWARLPAPTQPDIPTPGTPSPGPMTLPTLAPR